jgi:multiple sugar transport system permease protein
VIDLRRKRIKKSVLLIITIILVFIIVFPILWMIKISITPTSEVLEIPPRWIPSKINFSGYMDLLDRNFLRYYLNTIVVAFGTVIICLTVGILAAYSFSRFNYFGKNTLMVITLTTQMFPWALLIISLYLFFVKTSLLNNYFGLIIAHTTFALPLTIWIIKSYFDTIPKEIEESAEIDGCSKLRSLLTILIPMSYPGIMAAGIYTFLFSWNDFLFGLTLTTKDDMRILAPGMALTFIGQFQYRWVEMMAAAISVTVPVVIMFLFLQKYFVEGLTAGAVKG